MSTLETVPCSLKRAAAFVREHHRHHPRVVGGLWAVAAEQSGTLVGVAIVGRPVARMLDDGRTAEVTRLCTTGAKDACSLLYGACRRAARALGYRRLITYTLATEPGASLRGAGWTQVAETRAEQWSRPSRERQLELQPAAKIRWEAPL